MSKLLNGMQREPNLISDPDHLQGVALGQPVLFLEGTALASVAPPWCEKFRALSVPNLALISAVQLLW